MICGPGQRLIGGFPSSVQKDAGIGSTPGGDGQTFVRNIGKGGLPPTLGEPQCVPSSAPGEIERAARWQMGTGLNEQWIRLEELRFTGEKFGVPALAVADLF